MFAITDVAVEFRDYPVGKDPEFLGMNVNHVLGELRRRGWKIDRVMFGTCNGTENIVDLRKGVEGESFMRIRAKVQ